VRKPNSRSRLLKAAEIAVLFALLSCGGASRSAPEERGGGPSPAEQPEICRCTPEEPATSDYRHDAKHVSLPPQSPQPISVDTILGWEIGPEPAFNAPRSGRELEMFEVAQAWLQVVFVNKGDCDLHIEISGSPEKSAPRVIVETPIEAEYCSARDDLQRALSQRGFVFTNDAGLDLPQAVPVRVTGLAFQDFNHPRGSPQVATTWELHPAIVTVLP
jgi:hypothetical protein